MSPGPRQRGVSRRPCHAGRPSRFPTQPQLHGPGYTPMCLGQTSPRTAAVLRSRGEITRPSVCSQPAEDWDYLTASSLSDVSFRSADLRS
ncbi:unnamed protein product [Rangifer tarandus platyrhynchus]|uniref:Uncharacterized protein n=1 Tax=Rangifer tarandus platyrhynchus TaxID=3082113 RepID=A0AC59ZG99_RANTA